MDDELIGRWHAFAAQPKEDIAAQFSDTSCSLFAEIVTKSLRETSSGNARFASSDEFAQCVLDLRSNERAWSRYLGDVLLKAQDELDSGRAAQAKAILSNFQAICPWHSFAEIAETQLQNIDG